MGSATSTCGNYLRTYFYRYNAQHRALKFIEKNKLPTAPRHEEVNVNPKDDVELQERLYVKNKQLNEYLKKVYLTSDDEGKQLVVKSKRPLPVKRERPEIMFYEPPEPKPGHGTISTIFYMLTDYNQDPQKWNATALAEKYKLQRESVVNIVTNYSLFKQEEFEFMAADDRGPQKVDLEVNTKFKKIPKQLKIEGRK